MTVGRLATAALVLLTLLVSACSSSGGGKSVSVFRLKTGQCFQAPTTVKVQLSSLTEVPCSTPHTQEVYDVARYTGAANKGSVASSAGALASGGAAPSAGSVLSLTSSYPGDDVLSTFAQGACAQDFAKYVGVDYLDSTLFFTYLLPSARSWEQADDRNVVCFVTTTGAKLTKSVKGTKL